MSHSGKLFKPKPSPPNTPITHLKITDLNSLFDEFNTFFTTHFSVDGYPYSLMYRADEDAFRILEAIYQKQTKDSGQPRCHFHAWLLRQDLSPYQKLEKCNLTLVEKPLKETWHNDGYIYQRMEPLECSRFYMVRFGKISQIPIGSIQTFDALFMDLLANQTSLTVTRQQMERLSQLSATDIPLNYYLSDNRMSALDCVDFSYLLSSWLTQIIAERNIANLQFTVVSSFEPHVGNHAFTLLSIDPAAKTNQHFFLQLLKEYGYPIAEHQQDLLQSKSSAIKAVSPYTVAWDIFNPGGAKHQPSLLRSFPMNRLPYYLFNWDAKSMVPGNKPIYAVDFDIQKQLKEYKLLHSDSLATTQKNYPLRARL